MSREVKYSDPNMYSEGVLAYRETFNLIPNRGFRADIAATVKTYEDLCLWQDLLARWGYMKNGKWKKRSPLDVKGMLNVFEYKLRERERNEVQSKRDRVHCEESVSEWPARRMPE